jgi:integrase
VPHLEDWLNRWRDVFKPQHKLVFTQKNGKPYPNSGSFGSVLQQAARRLTGKAVTPHMLRHMLITYLKLNGASDAVMGSLAEAMHHSEEMQRRVYDRRCPQQRTQLAQKVVLDLAQGKPLSRSATGRPVTVEALWEDFKQLSPEEQRQIRELLLSQGSV